MWDTPRFSVLALMFPRIVGQIAGSVCVCVDLLWSRFNKLPARRNSKLSKSTSCLFIFYSLHTTQILGLCLSVAITFWIAVLKSLWLFVLIARQLKKPLSHSRAIPLSLSLSPLLFSWQKPKHERVRKKRYQAQANEAYITAWPGALSAAPHWPTRPRCSPIKSGQMPHSAVVVAVVVFVREAPLPPSATKQSKAKRRRKCGQKTSAALMGEEGGEQRGVERGKGKERLTEVEHCVFDSSPLPHSTPIPLWLCVRAAFVLRIGNQWNYTVFVVVVAAAWNQLLLPFCC